MLAIETYLCYCVLKTRVFFIANFFKTHRCIGVIEGSIEVEPNACSLTDESMWLITLHVE